MWINIKTLTGLTIYLDVELNDTIGEIKQKIYDKHNIPIESIQFFVNGIKFEDNARNLKHYSIKNGQTIYMLPY